MPTKSTHFTAHHDMPVKCCRCKARLREGDSCRVHVDGTGFVQYEHDEHCPKIKPHVWSENAHIQGSR